MVSSLLISHLTAGETSLDDVLGVIDLEIATRLTAVVKDSEKLYFDTTDEISLFNKRKYKVHICVGVVINMSPLSFSVLWYSSSTKLDLEIIHQSEMVSLYSPPTQNVPYINI